MIQIPLTEKAEQDFLKYIGFNHGYGLKDFELGKKLFLHSLIIDFFDSVNFYIDIDVIKDKSSGYVRGFESEVTCVFKGDLFSVNSDVLKDDIYESRIEATEKAILKANEIYNLQLS